MQETGSRHQLPHRLLNVMQARLSFLIKSLGISQKEFAESLGLKSSFISDLLNKRAKSFSQESLFKLHEKYDVNVNWLIANDGEMFLPAAAAGQEASPQPPNPLAELDKDTRKAVEGLVHVLVQRKVNLEPKGSLTVTKPQDYPHDKLREIPELGRIAAGLPNSEAQRDGKVLLFPRAVMPDKGPLYALRVYGESMRDLGIHKGDYAILKPVADPRELKPGTVVAALVDGENTLKRLYIHNGGATLRAANPEYRDIEVANHQELVVQGQLKYLIKSWVDD